MPPREVRGGILENAAGAIAHAIRAVTQPGDEVLTFAPYFPEYGQIGRAHV